MAGAFDDAGQPMGDRLEQSLGILLDAVVISPMQRAGMSSEQILAKGATLR